MKRYVLEVITMFCYFFNFCTHCWSRLKTKQVIKEYISGCIAEAEHRCIKCGSVERYEAYGVDARDYWRGMTCRDHPIWFLFLCLASGRFREFYYTIKE